MGKQAFEASLAEGRHRDLARMAGDWSGSFRLWFTPDEPACEAPQRGRIRSVLGGRFLLHEYESRFNDEPIEGIALYGFHLDENAWQTAWVESFGTGTQLMFCAGSGDDPRLNVLGSYGDGQGGPPWGWRTRLEQPDDDTLVITMFNITPAGEEAKAVETRYRRIG
ncbi:DUF1579 domain-containing protein [Pseudoxanthomonas wuyuanensis]|uniref:DUF1579 domain-containing protein n=1 Tax=Pseudoxanthomonas wuyuanensis TaxID=1073196 RepID=A0A286DB84_9GAMM|nr:DUF1579 domain-containing protein [Pseudoxanthomonas wuyuanensis]KAF1721777.1 DUF1579 domain-containing protein [Pseudoxanthomonas wuyuanensis]SOD55907.1 Protein of unknown function [Pseudoxanthomonas wuyuanensis]